LLPNAGHPLRGRESFHPFFIVGSGRSGNTLLRRVLYAHPDLHIPPETFVLGYSIRLFRQNRNLRWKDLVHLVLSTFEYYKAFDAFRVDSLRPLAIRLAGLPPQRRCLASILDGFYRYHAERLGRNCVRWGDKTPDNTFYLDRIFSVFPDAQFIHLVRDGCDVVYSFMSTGMYPSAIEAAKIWLAMVEHARRFCRRHAGNCMEVRYEDLVSRPEEIARGVSDFLGVEFRPEMLDSQEIADEMGDVSMLEHHRNVAAPITPAGIGKGRKNLSDEQKKIIQKIIGPTLDELGYNPCN
jgi:hypothetical protein